MKSHKAILLHLAQGWTLKSHRDEDGHKVYTLHALEGDVFDVGWKTVKRLQSGGYVYSNQKFPAATFLLTEKGRNAIKGLMEGEIKALGASRFFPKRK